MRTVQMELLRPAEIRAEQERISLVYLPVGPVEWHSFHMPMGTDGLIAQETARRAAAITGGVVAPTLFIGTERNDSRQMLANLRVPAGADDYILGMDFAPGRVPSLYLREEVFAAIVREHLRLLARMGYRMAVVVNGHGAAGQLDTLRRVCDEVSHECGARCVFPEFDGPRMGALIAAERLDPGHADRLETAMMMALTDSVALDKLPPMGQPLYTAALGMASGSQFGGNGPQDGHVPDDPRLATAALGEALMRANAEDFAEHVKGLYAQLS